MENAGKRRSWRQWLRSIPTQCGRLFESPPIQHGKGDNDLYGKAVDRLLRALFKSIEGGVDDKTKLLWAELIKFLPEYQKYHQGYSELESLIRFLGQRIQKPDEKIYPPVCLKTDSSEILGPPKV